jgi:hypothetical protein
MNMIHKWDQDERASWAMKQIQEYVGCCGASGNRYTKMSSSKKIDR